MPTKPYYLPFLVYQILWGQDKTTLFIWILCSKYSIKCLNMHTLFHTIRSSSIVLDINLNLERRWNVYSPKNLISHQAISYYFHNTKEISDLGNSSLYDSYCTQLFVVKNSHLKFKWYTFPYLGVPNFLFLYCSWNCVCKILIILFFLREQCFSNRNHAH